MSAWKGNADFIFVNEYIYDSYWSDLSGALIYRITSSRFLSALGRIVAKVIPSLRANTFGVGVRFRDHQGWSELFQSLGYGVVGYRRGTEEVVSLPRRLLCIKSCRRDTFVLRAGRPLPLES
ncbi:MAG: hypothetical protein Q7S20_06075 [Gemmatimonadaceae bacterium]|nr:hypothetical protein [Gemmatimonadaceae bacterium]